MSRLNRVDAEGLRRLLDEKKVLASAFGAAGKAVLNRLADRGVVVLKRLRLNSFEAQLLSAQGLNAYLAAEYDILDLDAYIDAMRLASPTRGDMAALGAGSKHRDIPPKRGMHIDGPPGSSVVIDGVTVPLGFPDFTALFVHERCSISLDPRTVIVGVENYEALVLSSRVLPLFAEYETVLFAEHGSTLKRFLSVVDNPYVHFGDIDLAGIRIFLSEYLPVVGLRGRYCIPATVETDLKKGKRSLYTRQLKRDGILQSDDPDLQRLIGLIHEARRGLEQEFYTSGRYGEKA